MKKLFFLSTFFYAAVISNAQVTQNYSVNGSNFINAGIGIGAYQKGLPVNLSYEHGFSDAVSGGVFFAYSSHSYNFDDINTDGVGVAGSYKLNIFYGGIRASYHFAKLLNVTNDKFDPYAGLGLGYYHVKVGDGLRDGVNAAYSSTVFLDAHIGARYMFSPSFGVYAEAGYGVAALNVGVTFKF